MIHNYILNCFFTTQSKYGWMIFLIGGFFIVELIVGLISESLSLQTDAFHMLSDLLALIIGLTAHLLAQKEKNLRYTYGWIRAEIIGGLINSVFLLALCFTIFLDIVEKLIKLTEQQNNPKLAQEIDLVLIVAGVGLAINLLGLVLFSHHHSERSSERTMENSKSEITTESDSSSFDSFDSISISITNSLSDSDLIQQTLSLNDHAVWLHVLGDTLGSLVVIITGLLIKYLDGAWRFWLDPIASLLLVIFITYSSGRLLIRSGKILLHRSNNDGGKLLKEIEELPGVMEIHEFHIWPLTESINVATLHVRLDEHEVKITDIMIRKINQIVHRYGIHSCTIQPEFDECLEHLCQNNCQDLQCC